MRLLWAIDWDMKGNGYGYSTHQRMLRAALEARGVIMAEDAETAVHIVVPTGFEPIPGKRNILYSMYEGDTLPEDWIAPLQQADLIVVPCTHNKRIFERYTTRPVEVCPEGVDVDRFTYHERQFPLANDFMFLWNGASNPRKGYEHVAQAWRIMKEKHREEWRRSILLLKTTQATTGERLITSSPNRFHVDTRDYSIENLVTLYHTAHCFLFPTMGEGFGLTLAEAMSTGLPCIYTPWSGPKDFISEREGYPLRFSMHDTRTVKIMPDGMQQPYHTTISVSPDPRHLAQRMVQVFNGYTEALARGRRAAERVRRELTWDLSAQRFMTIVEQYTGEKAVAA